VTLPLTAADAEVDASGPSISASSIIENGSDSDVNMVDVYAIAYDASGAIIGGGATLLNAVAARDSAFVSIPLVALGDPERVDVYAGS
jgi:hypothetical protein